ncbi:MAG: hypothetical protein WAL30_04395 [Candidatus Aquirickettsiella sp.]
MKRFIILTEIAAFNKRFIIKNLKIRESKLLLMVKGDINECKHFTGGL